MVYPSYSNPHAQLQGGHTRSHGDDFANDFVAGYDRVMRRRSAPLDLVQFRVTHPAGFHRQQYFIVSRPRYR